MKYKKETLGMICVIIAGSCWGIIGLFTRYLSSIGFNSVQNTFIRNLVAAIGMALVILMSDSARFRIRLKDVWLFIGTGICSIVFFNICYFKTIQMTTMSIAAVLLYTAPCFVMMMSCVFFKEKLTVQKGAALIMAFIGCILSTGLMENSQSLSVGGFILGLGAGFGYALYSIFGCIALKKYHTFTVTFYTFLIAAIALAPFSGFCKLATLEITDSRALLYSLLLGGVSTLIPFLVYTKGLTYLDAGKASIMAFIEPLVATVCGILFFHEKLTMMNGCGIGLIFISIILLNMTVHSKMIKGRDRK